jgi:hypothetical protein
VVYYLVVSNAEQDRRQGIDNELGVAAWPGPVPHRRSVPVIPGAPAWWAGEEEASDSFLAAMGVQLADGSQVG